MKASSFVAFDFLRIVLVAVALPVLAQSSAPGVSDPTPVRCTITAAAPLESYDASGSMTGVTTAQVGQKYTCTRVENGKAVLQDASGHIFSIRVDAVSQTPRMSAASLPSAMPVVAVAAAAPAIDHASGPPITPSPYVPDGYTEVWGDEFNDRNLDTSKWWTRIIYGEGWTDHLNDEQERYRENNNHVMTGTTLQLVARKVHDGGPKAANYESGMIRSKATFKYAYFEARIKVPSQKGTWPAFWMTSDADEKGHATWPPEMDVLEMANNIKNDKPDMMHIGAVVQPGKNGSPSPWDGTRLFAADSSILQTQGLGLAAYYHAPFRFCDDFHVFALLWQSDDTLTWYCDGVKLMQGRYKWVTYGGHDAPDAHIILNLAIGGNWAGRFGIDDAAFPAALEVDYVRVYQKEGEGLMGVGKVGQELYKPSQ